jgi:hypothetical protein
MALTLRLRNSENKEMRIVNSPVNDEALPDTGEDRRQPPPTPESIVMAAMQLSISRAIYTVVALDVPKLIDAEPQSSERGQNGHVKNDLG